MLTALPLLLNNAFSTTVEYTRDVVVPPVYASEARIEPIETIEQKIDRIATAHGIPTTTLYNLVKSESNFDPKADNGKDRGIVQINRNSFPEITDEQAFDVEFSLNFASEKIANDEEYLWVACNCYAFAQVLTSKLPKMMDIVPNSNYPRVGGLVVLRYKNNKHIGVVDEVVKEGVWIREANFEPCKIGKRLIEWEDPHLKGFVDYRN